MELAFPTASGYIAVPRSHPQEDAAFNRGDSVCVAAPHFVSCRALGHFCLTAAPLFSLAAATCR